MTRVSRTAKCRHCRRPILFATVIRLDGTMEHRVRVNARPVPGGRLQYVRGSVAHPVLRELDDPDRLLAHPDADRYTAHLDTVRPDRRTVAAGADR